MNSFNKIIVYIIIVLIYAITRKFLQKHLCIKDSFIYHRKNNLHLWLEVTVLIILFIGFFIWGFVYMRPVEFYYYFGLFSIFLAFRTVFEWKFDKNSKRYIVSILDSVMFFIVFVISLLII